MSDLARSIDHGNSTISCMVPGQGGVVASVPQRSYPDLRLEDLRQLRSELPAESAGSACAEYLARQHELVINRGRDEKVLALNGELQEAFAANGLTQQHDW